MALPCVTVSQCEARLHSGTYCPTARRPRPPGLNPTRAAPRRVGAVQTRHRGAGRPPVLHFLWALVAGEGCWACHCHIERVLLCAAIRVSATSDPIFHKKFQSPQEGLSMGVEGPYDGLKLFNGSRAMDTMLSVEGENRYAVVAVSTRRLQTLQDIL